MGGKGTKGGRPLKEVDYDTIDKLCAINCNTVEILDFLNCRDRTAISEDTISRRIKQDHGIGFAEYVKQKANSTCKVGLRRAQMRLVQEGNPTMIIFLSKNMLGMADKTQTEITGKDGGAIEIDSPRERIERRIALIATRIGTEESPGGDNTGGTPSP